MNALLVNHDEITIIESSFNWLVNDFSDINVLVTPSSNVGDECAGGSYVEVTMSYEVTADCNGNGTVDVCDIVNGVADDCNDNRVPDACDITNAMSKDCNANTIPDECDISSATSADCNSNAIPDECDISTAVSEDCNGNAVPDECDIADGGGSQDRNGNSIPDECDAPDADDDEDVDLADFAVFQQCFGATTNADDCLTSFERVSPDFEINADDYGFFASWFTGPQPAPAPAAMAAPMAMASSTGTAESA